MGQAMVDRAAVAAFPELKRLIDLRVSTEWTWSVYRDPNGEVWLVAGARVHVDGSRDEIGVRSESAVRVVRFNPLNEAVVMREGSLGEMVDLLRGLPSPLHPKTPSGVVSGALPRLWVPSPDGRGRTHWVSS